MGEAAPPSYNSVFGQLKQQKTESSGLADYTKNACGVVKSKIGGVCGLVIFILCLTVCSLGLPIAEIVIGALHLEKCEFENLLPVYLIVLGVNSLMVGCGRTIDRIAKKNLDDEEQETSFVSKICGCLSALQGAFLFSWFICGNVWVFQMRKCDMETFNVTTTEGCFTTDMNYQTSKLYCNQLLYDFVYWETIARWACFGAILVLGCFGSCVICCVYCCNSSSE